ncbi:hypothetical protein [Streptomyces sp. NPDC001404]|uniref:hypothetical protein n=1 Tax=Streptomyces sp. NPDC001404 TaxID=3364571 RepID=UPI0036BAD5EA
MTVPSQLPPAVPAYQPDADQLHRKLGEAIAFISQLGAEMQRRASEANTLHDTNQALTERIAELEAALEHARGVPPAKET